MSGNVGRGLSQGVPKVKCAQISDGARWFQIMVQILNIKMSPGELKHFSVTFLCFDEYKKPYKTNKPKICLNIYEVCYFLCTLLWLRFLPEFWQYFTTCYLVTDHLGNRSIMDYLCHHHCSGRFPFRSQHSSVQGKSWCQDRCIGKSQMVQISVPRLVDGVLHSSRVRGWLDL